MKWWALKLPESTGGGFEITYSAAGLPAGLRLTQDRIIRGTPQAATNGPVTVTYTVTDEAGGLASLSFQVTVNPALTFSDEVRRFLQREKLRRTTWARASGWMPGMTARSPSRRRRAARER